MTGLLAAKTAWLVALNVGLAVLVLLPVIAVLAAVVVEIVKRVRSRRKDVRYESLPGIGRVPILRFEPGRPRRRKATDPAPGS